MAVAAPRRRADRNEDRFGERTGSLKYGRKRQPACSGVGRTRSCKPGSINRNFAALERLDFCGILVDTDDMMTEFGDAGSGYQPDISSTDHCNAHDYNASLTKRAGNFWRKKMPCAFC